MAKEPRFGLHYLCTYSIFIELVNQHDQCILIHQKYLEHFGDIYLSKTDRLLLFVSKFIANRLRESKPMRMVQIERSLAKSCER